ncbi:hypothetical protein OQA88_3469 [Cercophora sp. LCS_1]
MFQRYNPQAAMARQGYAYRRPQRRDMYTIHEAKTDHFDGQSDDPCGDDPYSEDSDLDMPYSDTSDSDEPDNDKRYYPYSAKRQETYGNSDSDVPEMHLSNGGPLRDDIFPERTEEPASPAFSFPKLLARITKWSFILLHWITILAKDLAKHFTKHSVALAGIALGISLLPFFGLQPWSSSTSLIPQKYNGIEYRPVKSPILDTTSQLLLNLSTIPTESILILNLDDPSQTNSFDPIHIRDLTRLVTRLANKSCTILKRELSTRQSTFQKYASQIGFKSPKLNANPDLQADIAKSCLHITKRERFPADGIWDRAWSALQSIDKAKHLADEILLSLNLHGEFARCGKRLWNASSDAGDEYKRCARFLVNTLDSILVRGHAGGMKNVLPFLRDALMELDLLRGISMELDVIRILVLGDGDAEGAGRDAARVHRALRYLDWAGLSPLGGQMHDALERLTQGIIPGITEIVGTVQKMQRHEIPAMEVKGRSVRALEGGKVDNVWVLDTEDLFVREVVFLSSVAEAKKQVSEVAHTVGVLNGVKEIQDKSIKDRLLQSGVGDAWGDNLDNFVGRLLKKLDPEVDAEYDKKAKEYIGNALDS